MAPHSGAEQSDSFPLSSGVVGDKLVLSGFMPTSLPLFAVIESMAQGSVNSSQADYYISAHDCSFLASSVRDLLFLAALLPC